MKNILCREIFECFPVSTYLLELRLMMIHMNEWKLLRQADRAGGSLGWRNKICIEHRSLVEKLLSFELFDFSCASLIEALLALLITMSKIIEQFRIMMMNWKLELIRSSSLGHCSTASDSTQFQHQAEGSINSLKSLYSCNKHLSMWCSCLQ